MFGIELRIIPRISACIGNRAISISPVTFTPIATQGTDARMTDSGCKQVGLCLQVLCHETAIAGTGATDFLRVDERMFFAELFCSLDDFIGGLVSPGVYVTGGELLSEAGRAAWVQSVDHIAEGCIHVHGVAEFQRTVSGRGSAIIIDDHRIFPGCVEVGREIIAPLNDGPVSRGEIPVVHFSELDVFQFVSRQVVDQLCLLTLGVVAVQAVGVGYALSVVIHDRSGFG